MPEIERIDSVYNIPAISSEHESLQKILQQDTESIVTLFETLEKFQNKSNIANVAKNWGEVTNAIDGTAASSQEMMQMQQKLNDLLAKNALLQKQYSEALRNTAGSAKGAAGDTAGVTKAINDSTQSLEDNIRQQNAYRNKLAEIRKDLKDLQKAMSDTDGATEARIKTQEELTLMLEQTKFASSDLQKVIRQQIKETESADGSTRQLEASLALLREAYHNLSPAEREAATGQELFTNINEVDAAVKKLKGDTGQFQENVGNYVGAFAEPFNVLKDLLTSVNQQIDNVQNKAKGVQNLGAAGPVGFDVNKNKPGGSGTTSFTTAGGQTISVLNEDTKATAGLVRQQQILNKVMTDVSGEFTTSRQAMRAYQEAVIQLGLEFGATDTRVTKLKSAVGDVDNSINDLKSALKFQSQDAKLLLGLTSAVNGLVGAFGAAQAAVALTGEESEDTQKQMAKFQQLLVLINGLQQVSNSIQEESGAVQLALSAKIGLTNAAMAIQNMLFAAKVQAVTADTAALEANTVAETANAEATAVDVAAKEAETAATVEATGATTALTTAISIGLAGAIVAVGALIIWLVSKIPGWIQGSQLTAKQQEALAEVMKNANKAIVDQIELMNALDSSQKTYYQNALSLSQAAGENVYRQYYYEKQLVAVQKEQAQQNINSLGADNKTQAARAAQIQDLTNKQQAALDIQKRINSTPIGKQTSNDKRQLEAAEKNYDLYQKQIDAVKVLYDAGEKARKDFFDSDQKDRELSLKMEKFTADEKRKYILESAKATADNIKDINSKVLSDERSTLNQRLAAVKSNAQQEVNVAKATLSDVVNNNSSTPTQIKEAQLQYETSIKKIARDRFTQERDTRYQYYVRDRDAQVEIFNLEQQDRKANAEKILADEDSTFDQRHKALASSYEADRAIIGAEFLKEIDQLGLTNEEKLKISADYNSKLLKLNIDHEKTLEEEQKKEREKQLKQLEDFYEKQKNLQTIQQSGKAVDLNSEFLNGGIGTDKFERQREQQAYEDQKAQAALEVQQAFGRTQQYKEGTKERLDAEAKLAEETMHYSDLVTQHELDNIKKRNELQQEAAEQTASTITALVDDAFEQQITNIEKVKKRDNALADAQKKRIQDSTLGEQQKAQAIAYIQAQQDNNNKAIERREHDIKVRQAKFDRDVAVAETIQQGAVAAIAALKIPVYGEAEAIAIGIITAAKVAEILARPLPTYGFGTTDHPGDLAIVGDRYQKELIKEPGRNPYWSPDVPTVVDLPKHTQVIPLDQIDRMSKNGMFVNGNGVLIVNEKKQDMKGVEKAINNQTNRLEYALKNQRKTIVVKQTMSPKLAEHINNQIYK